MRWSFIILLLAIGYTLLTGPVSAQSTDPYWNMAGANPQRSSWVNQNFNSNNYGIIWARPIEAYIDQKTQIVSAESDATDTIYIATTRGLYALQASTGALRWRYDTELPLGHTPTVIGDTIFFGAYDKKVHAFRDNGASYTPLWEFVGDAGFSTSPIVANNTVYIGSRGGHFYALNANTGDLEWQYPPTGQDPIAPISYSAAYDGINLYFAARDNHAYALNAATGSLVWKSTQKLPGMRYESWWPVIMGDLVIFSGSTAYRGEYTNGDCATSPGIEQADLACVTSPLTFAVAINYLTQKPWRQTIIALNRINGSSGPIIPFGFQGTKSGNRYPPLVNTQTQTLYALSPYTANGWIPRAKLLSWHVGDTALNVYGGDYPVDESLGFSGSGSTIYSNLCCDRQIAVVNGSAYWPYITNALESMIPGYRLLWQEYNGGGETHLQMYYAGLAQNYNYSRTNGIYHSHGNQNPVIPYAQKLFSHRSNTIIALGAGGVRYGSSDPGRVLSTLTYHLQNQPLDTIVTPSTQQLTSTLEFEVRKILSVYQANPGSPNRFLRPEYYNYGQGVNNRLRNEEEYFNNPGDTLQILSQAYHHLTSPTLKSQLKGYLQDYYQTFFVTTPLARIGYATGSSHGSMEFPPDITHYQNLNNQISGFEGRSMYGLYHYARLFDRQSETVALDQIYDLATSRLSSTCPTSSYPTETVYDYNECLAHWQGYLNLQTYLQVPLNQTVQTNLNNQLASRTTNFNKDFQSSSMFVRKLNVSRNFMFMVSELGAYWRQHRFDYINSALYEYNYLTPFWFISGNDNTLQESTMHPLYDSTMLLAKAWVQQATRQELYKYLDAPAYPIGDLLYLQNLLTVIEASSDPNYTPPPASPTPIPIDTDLDGDNDVDILDLLKLVLNFNSSVLGNFNLIGPVDIFDFNTLISNL